MNHQQYATQNACCFTQRAQGIDPRNVDNTVAAGEVCTDNACPLYENGSCRLATIYFPSQTYRAGYCPGEALQKGTLFPELVSNYETRCPNGND
ncbi:MAG: spore coat associated protein CotJA [Eubacteriales bacterium]|nr:spore coat associated protein CotJA [Eubacteriales bacterium]